MINQYVLDMSIGRTYVTKEPIDRWREILSFHEPLSLARTLKDKENRFNFPNARSLVSASHPILVFSSFPFPLHRQIPSLRFICLPLACSCPIPSPNGSFSTSASSFPWLFRSLPFSLPLIFLRVRPARSSSSQSDVNLRSTPSNLRDERTFFR